MGVNELVVIEFYGGAIAAPEPFPRFVITSQPPQLQARTPTKAIMGSLVPKKSEANAPQIKLANRYIRI